MNDTEMLAETTVIPSLPIRNADQIGQPNMIIVPCDEPRCIWKGGEVVEDWDPAVIHQALVVDEPGFEIEVNRAHHETEWTVWAYLDCDDGRTHSSIARNFTAALEIAEDMAAELNGH